MNNHALYIYQHDTYLIDTLARFVKTGLEADETVLVVATRHHLSDLRERLITDHLIDLGADRAGRYVTLNAEETLSLFMAEGWPDERRFDQAIGRLVASIGGGRPLRIYGEMVAVLCEEGRHDAAIRLEGLWNKLGRQHPFTLLCAYPDSAFAGLS